jgi:hypothetical protein
MNTQLIKSIAYIYSEIASLTLAIGPIKNPPLRRVYFVHSQGGWERIYIIYGTYGSTLYGVPIRSDANSIGESS